MAKAKIGPGILLVANWDSAVGYAWWLMEAYWVKIYETFSSKYTVYIAYPSISEIPARIKNSEIVVDQIDFSGRGVSAARVQANYIRKRNIKVVYFSDCAHLDLRYAMYRFLGVKKIVVHDHTPGLRVPPSRLKGWIKSKLNSISILTPDAMVGATEFVKKRIIGVNRFPPGKTYCVQNGIEADNDRRIMDVHALYEIPEGRTIMVCAGRATHYKGIEFAIECIRKIVQQDRGSTIHFLFFGDGPDLDYFKQRSAELGVLDRVTFAGRQSHLISMFRSCAFAIHPSQGEVGYSLTILEYMKAGLPVIVPDNPSVCSATTDGKTGFHYKDRDLDSACEKIQILSDSKDVRDRMGKIAHEKVNTDYSLESAEKKIVNIFMDLGI